MGCNTEPNMLQPLPFRGCTQGIMLPWPFLLEFQIQPEPNWLQIQKLTLSGPREPFSVVNHEIRRREENPSDRRPFMEVVGNADSVARGRQVTKGDWGPPEDGW